MKKQLILVVVLLLLAGLAVGCGSSEATKVELKTFTPEGKNFSADFAGEPTVDSFTVDSPYGEQLTDTYVLEGKYSMQSMAVTVLPEELMSQDHSVILTNSANGAVDAMKGDNKEITDIEMLSSPAKSYKCSITTPDDQKLVFEGHMVIIGNSLYQMQYACVEKNWDKFQEEREAFFNSLVINE